MSKKKKDNKKNFIYGKKNFEEVTTYRRNVERKSFKYSIIYKELNKKLDNLNYVLSKNNILDLAELLGNRKQLFIRNLWSGMAKGIGIGIGVTVITAVLIITLQKIVTLNIPVIGEYIADIVDIVERSR